MMELGADRVYVRTITTLITTIVNLAFRDYNIYKKRREAIILLSFNLFPLVYLTSNVSKTT